MRMDITQHHRFLVLKKSLVHEFSRRAYFESPSNGHVSRKYDIDDAQRSGRPHEIETFNVKRPLLFKIRNRCDRLL
ncbi:unnamed protein product [Nezara viridula]|uniref:Uncharacterized protein n=1 Tax=Nezara viridula TaxID=85310 RepID=A0A9P0ECY9_NEZVI|nr:unnamed protein product [Nezara viridula]